MVLSPSGFLAEQEAQVVTGREAVRKNMKELMPGSRTPWLTAAGLPMASVISPLTTRSCGYTARGPHPGNLPRKHIFAVTRANDGLPWTADAREVRCRIAQLRDQPLHHLHSTQPQRHKARAGLDRRSCLTKPGYFYAHFSCRRNPQTRTTSVHAKLDAEIS